MIIRREWFEELIFRGAASRRFTQDSPVLPDVWLHFALREGEKRGRRLDLLLTPHRDATAADLAFALRQRLSAEQVTASRPPRKGAAPDAGPLLAYTQANVVVRLTLAELLRVAMPLSKWWRDSVPGKTDDLAKLLATPTHQPTLIAALRRVAADPEQARPAREARFDATPEPPTIDGEPIPPDLLWMLRVVGTIVLASREKAARSDDANKRRFFALSRAYKRIVNEVAKLLAGMRPPDRARHASLLHAVTRNREVSPAVSRSVLAVKADAARRVFEVDFRNLSWAILDAGIDARHPAFRKRNKEGNPEATHFGFDESKRGSQWTNNTRVVRTFDFSRIREILNPDLTPETRRDAAPQVVGAMPKAALTAVAPSEESPEASGEQLDAEALEARAQQLTQRLQRGRSIDWSELEPFLEVLHDDATYAAPVSEHGTHVAGILAGDWRRTDESFPSDEPEDLVGVCPTLSLYDLRVLGPDGIGDEFTVMAALQFIRYLNATRDQMVIQGANLSLSLRHDVANYACGRTPVCDECDRVVSSGVVVVAAAGNDGHIRFTTPSGDSEGYRSISISDPGNAENVITVGSTHRSQPHTFGVSYFSSRGPTGDGRNKPDLVAPGEKITAPVLRDGVSTKDGTSMAAPHVSGAAALLMARHRELIGRPLRVKQILCSSATDLGRERYFQGSGMVDVLRAIQSV